MTLTCNHLLQLAPSALEQPQTVLRDPAFYQMYKRMDYFMQMYKNRLPRYTYEQVSGVTTVHKQVSGVTAAHKHVSGVTTVHKCERCYCCAQEVIDVTTVHEQVSGVTAVHEREHCTGKDLKSVRCTRTVSPKLVRRRVGIYNEVEFSTIKI